MATHPLSEGATFMKCSIVPNFGPRSTGPHMDALLAFLLGLSEGLADIEFDGVYGSVMSGEIRKLQRKNGLLVTGNCDAQTQTLLARRYQLDLEAFFSRIPGVSILVNSRGERFRFEPGKETQRIESDDVRDERHPVRKVLDH